jgi:hypothetical protein
MSNVRENTVKESLTAGSNVDVLLDPDHAYVRTVIAVTGNITGTITVTKKIIGATRFTALNPAGTIDLTASDELIIQGAGLAAINVAHAGTGAAMSIRVTQLSI